MALTELIMRVECDTCGKVALNHVRVQQDMAGEEQERFLFAVGLGVLFFDRTPEGWVHTNQYLGLMCSDCAAKQD